MRVEGVGRRLHARPVAAFWPKRETGGTCCFERIDHVQIMGPGLGPILPRMHGCVGADEILLSPRGRSFRVVPLQGLLIVGALVAEKFAKGLQLGTARNQPNPKIMANLTAKMPQSGAVGLPP